MSTGFASAVKPLFIHFSSATTKLATAHAVVDLLEFFARGRTVVIPGQVVLDGEFVRSSRITGRSSAVGPEGMVASH